MQARPARLVVLALVTALLGPPLVATSEAAVVLCQRKNKIRLRVDACKKKEIRVDPGELTPCAPDSVRVAGVCLDRVEASIWRLPPGATELVDSIRNGTVTLEGLTTAGAFQLGDVDGFLCGPGDYPSTFPRTGAWTEPLYAVALPGVVPSRCVTWFQAQQACALSGKRLPTNAEWQLAATGTPDPGADDGSTTCAVGGTVVGGGGRPARVADAGV